jgi:hypothetical protein
MSQVIPNAKPERVIREFVFMEDLISGIAADIAADPDAEEERIRPWLQEVFAAYSDSPEALGETIHEAERGLRVYPAKDGKDTVDTCHLVDDLTSIVQRLTMIRNGAWQSPPLHRMIGADELIDLTRQALAQIRVLARSASVYPRGGGR